MRLLAYLGSLASRFAHPSQTDADIEDELRSHIELRANDLERSGLNRAEAERRARIEFGGHGRFKEEAREALGGHFIETLVMDLRYSLRVLRKSPGFPLVAAITLALAIGANAVVFGVLDALILRPLALPRARSLYGIERASDKLGQESYPNYLDLRDRNRSFDGLAAFNFTEAALDTGEHPSRVWGYEVTGNYFDVLGIQPYLGRLTHPADEHGPASAPYVVLSYSYWRSHFGADREVAGRVVRVNRRPFTIIGVTPPDFLGTLVFFRPAFFVPIVNYEPIDGGNLLNDRESRWLGQAIGHLKPGVGPAQTAADLNSIGSYIEKSYPKEEGQLRFLVARPGLGGEYLVPIIQEFLTALWLLAGLVLLAACANLGTLFAARAADRSREVALRLALGSSRFRILRGLFSEAVLISLAGGAAGLWGSLTLLGRLSAWQPFLPLPFSVPASANATLCLVALALALVSAVLFVIVPVRQVLRLDPYQVVKAGPGSAPGRRTSLRDILLAVQVAICAVLITASLVAVRGMTRSLDRRFGIEPRHALLVETNLSMAGYRSDKVPAMQRRMIDAVQMIPGVTSVGLVDGPPLNAACCGDLNVFADNAADLRPANAVADPQVFRISPGYFRAAGTVMLAGRDFTWHDDQKAPRVAVVNREFARQVFGSPAAAMGSFFRMKDGSRTQVVGMVEDGKYMVYLPGDSQSAMFLPILQWPTSESWLVVRSSGDPEPLAAAVRGTLRHLDEGLPLFIETWSKGMDTVLFASRVATVSLGILGAIGAILSVTGIFGMAAYTVSKRLKELGIRMALGAQPREVLEAALGRALKLLAIGSAAGLIVGMLTTRLLASIVYRANPRDPLVMTGVVGAMTLLGLAATWIPAQRALSLDPVTLLREE